jgi:hypothetical protein
MQSSNDTLFKDGIEMMYSDRRRKKYHARKLSISSNVLLGGKNMRYTNESVEIEDDMYTAGNESTIASDDHDQTLIQFTSFLRDSQHLISPISACTPLRFCLDTEQS